MYRIALCDDNRSELVIFEAMLKRYQELHQEIDIQTQSFTSSAELLKYRKSKTSFDIYLLDILMPKMNGIDLGMNIREDERNSSIIYLTNSEDFALEAFKVYAFQYLVKPIDAMTLFSVLDRALDKMKREDALCVAVKTRTAIVKIAYSEISHIEINNHVLYYHLIDGSVLISTHIRISFEEATQGLVASGYFIQCHKSYLVNMNKVKKLMTQQFVMNNDDAVPISRTYYSKVKAAYMDYLTNHISHGGFEGKTRPDGGVAQKCGL